MADQVANREKAIKIFNQATQLDAQGQVQEAYKQYKLAAKHFFFVMEYEPNEQIKGMMRNKAEECITRCEQLQQNPPSQQQTTGPIAAGQNKEEEKKNEANSGLKAQLEGSVVSEKPNVKWSDVAGLENAKMVLQEAVIYPMKYPEIFTGQRKPWKGILLYGPPGTGKSYLAKACATEAEGQFFSVSSADLVSKYLGESERLVRSLFEMARERKPAVIFIDEIDSLCGQRGEGSGNDATTRVKTEFLVQMDGVGHDDSGVLVLGATNTPWSLDIAMRRRFERRVYIALPDEPARNNLFKVHLGQTPHNLTEDDFQRLAAQSEGFSGADIKTLVTATLMEPVRHGQRATNFIPSPGPEGRTLYTPCDTNTPNAIAMTLMDVPANCLKVRDITADDFFNIMTTSKPSVAPNDLVQQQEWTNLYGMEG